MLRQQLHACSEHALPTEHVSYLPSPKQLDHIYSADYFLLLLALLGASLAACTATNQWPAVKVARRWRFKADETSLARLQVGTVGVGEACLSRWPRAAWGH